jgi:hypothetical protein
MIALTYLETRSEDSLRYFYTSERYNIFQVVGKVVNCFQIA